MENASKALLIAGAILIVIILISVGMLIVNSTQDISDQATTTATTQAIQTFNQAFTNYEGTQKGSVVKSLYQSVVASNAANTDSGHTITWTGTAGSDMSAISNSKKYTVKLGYNSEGYVDTITVDNK